ncbi:hypothetical protein BH11CYA1_BH11CYA1_49140 [soil metagenome]
MIKSTNEAEDIRNNQEVYDRALATALRLDALIDKKNSNPFAARLTSIFSEFKNDMVELGQKLASGTNKIAALIFMRPDFLHKSEPAHQLQYSAILIRQPDISHLFAPASPPVSMNKKSDVESKKKVETSKLKKQLKQELMWFQEFGSHGQSILKADSIDADTLASSSSSSSGSSNEKAKRRLSLVSDHIQAA